MSEESKRSKTPGAGNGKKKKMPRRPRFREAAVSFLGLVVVMSIGIAKFHVDPHIPMFLGIAGRRLSR